MIDCRIETGRPYSVLVGAGLLAEAGERIGRILPSEHTVIVTDTNVAPLYLAPLQNSLEKAGITSSTIIIPAGESSKNWTQLGYVVMRLMEEGLTRADYVIALGGGVIGDLTGFAASIYLRGIPFVQIPTTLLAAVDSSVGGKTAVDLGKGKNQAGTFWQPSLVLMDTDVLHTLPEEVFREGVAESIKYGILKDPELFREIAEDGMHRNPEQLIASCVRMKGEYVKEDERDHGARQFLNLGHTFAHGIEAVSNFSVSHGNAVAIGMCLAAEISDLLHLGEQPCRETIRPAIASLGLPTVSPYGAEEIIPWMYSDKKRKGSRLTLVLPRQVGECVLYPVTLEQAGELLRKVM